MLDIPSGPRKRHDTALCCSSRDPIWAQILAAVRAAYLRCAPIFIYVLERVERLKERKASTWHAYATQWIKDNSNHGQADVDFTDALFTSDNTDDERELTD